MPVFDAILTCGVFDLRRALGRSPAFGELGAFSSTIMTGIGIAANRLINVWRRAFDRACPGACASVPPFFSITPVGLAIAANRLTGRPIANRLGCGMER